jgi:hypothetical protein
VTAFALGASRNETTTAPVVRAGGAGALRISGDTVKHHLSRVRVATGCATRAQLALAWQREVGAPPAAGRAAGSPPVGRR